MAREITKANRASENNDFQTSQSKDVKSIKDLKGYVDEQLESLSLKVYESDNRREENQIKLIEVLGIFMALLAFISINVQIFSRVKDVLSAGLFIFLFFCLISILILIMDLVLNYKQERSDKVDFIFYKDHRIISIMIFISVGLFSLYVLKDRSLNLVEGTLEFESAVENKLDKMVEETINDTYTKDEVNVLLKNQTKEVDTLKQCLKSGGWSKCF